MKRIIALWAVLPTLVWAAVTTTKTEESYTCGAVTAFAVPYRFLDQTHLVVTKTDLAGATTTLALGTDYSVVKTPTGGTVTLTSLSKCASGTLKIRRQTPKLQPTTLRGQGAYTPATHEDALDRIAMQAQENDRTAAETNANFQGLETYVDGLAAGGQVVLPLTFALTGDGSTKTFSVPGIDVSAATSYWAAVDGVLQKPTADYSLDATADTITFVTAPPLGAAIEVRSITYSKAQSVNDNTTITATGTTTARSLRDRHADILNVKDFGAKGDDATHDEGGFQAAVSALPAATLGVGPYYQPITPGGGTVYLPPGNYHVYSQITVPRGAHVKGAGREATRIISHVTGSVFKFADAGLYVARDIAFEDLSIYQASGVTPTSGAAIEVAAGSSTAPAIQLVLRNVSVEGTYYGILVSAAMISSISNTTASRCVSHGVYVKWDGTFVGAYGTQTTSIKFDGAYSYFNGGDGFRVEGAAFPAWVTSGADSNGGYGYYFDTTMAASLLSSSAEQNTGGGIYLKNAQGTFLSMNVIDGFSGSPARTRYAILTESSVQTTVVGGFFSATGGTTGKGISIVSGDQPIVIASKFTGAWAGANVASTLLNQGIFSDATGNFRAANIYGTNLVQAVGFTAVASGSYGTCDASTEAYFKRITGTGGTGTTKRTALCFCTSDGAASPAYAWQNLSTGTVGTATTCP